MLPRIVCVVPCRAHSTGAPRYLLFVVSPTQRDIREGPHVLRILRAVAIVDHV